MKNVEEKICDPLTVINGGIDWTKFFDEYWLRRPVLYRQPFDRPLIDQHTVLEVLKRYRNDLANNQKRHIIVYDKNRVPKNGILTSRRNDLGVHKLLPRQDHVDFNQYLQTLSSIENYDEFCIYIQDANTDDEVWKVARSFLHQVVPYIPFSPSKVTCDFFIGNYTKTNFGAHKDPVDNMMFMLFGKRTMVMWDDYTWKHVLGNPDDDKHIDLDYQKFRDAALVCTLEPGDVLYWPASHWHVGENDRKLSGSFNIDFLVTDQDMLADDIIKETLAGSVKRIGRRVHKEFGKIDQYHIGASHSTTLPGVYKEVMDAITTSLRADTMEKELSSWWLKKNSSFGQMTAPGRRHLKKVTADTLVSRDMRFPVIYSVVDSTLLISHSGHVLYLSSYIDAFKSIIEKLNTLETFTANFLHDTLNMAGLSIEAVIDLLTQLYTIHAVEIAE